MDNHNLITGVTSHHLYHIIFVRSKSRVHSTQSRGGDDTAWGEVKGNIRILPPTMVLSVKSCHSQSLHGKLEIGEVTC